MKVKLWGTRGSLASPGPETARYGGNTSCVEVQGRAGTVLVLDAGTGIRRLGLSLPRSIRRVDVLLTHLHMDHIQGLAFFAPLRHKGVEAHVWGPASTTLSLRARLTKYLSPPLFPVHLRDLDSTLFLHEVPCAEGDFDIGEFRLSADLVCHPDPTVGFRITERGRGGATVTYLPDHEPALGMPQFPLSPDWTSGWELAEGVDLLIHDAQYTTEEYEARIGFGHSTLRQAIDFGGLAGIKRLVPFHHDPGHTDDDLDRISTETVAAMKPRFEVAPGAEGTTFEVV